MRSTERVTVTLPKQVVDRIRASVEADAAETVSGYIAEVLVERFREETVDLLLADMEAVGDPMTEAAREWARETVRAARSE
jgi:Arc/MetJ-type ribon-helix-helix transcriptional regulator